MNPLMLAMPAGPTPEPVAADHFPDRLHAFVWRNWTLVPVERMAETVGADPGQILELGRRMGLPESPIISDDQWRRSYITIIRRNWHLLPMDQLCRLLDWTPDQMAYSLREDDFLWVKLGLLKPRCEPLAYSAPDAAAVAREQAIAAIVREVFPDLAAAPADPLFGFIEALSTPLPEPSAPPAPSLFSPIYCYSYFALYGDPLLEAEIDPFPDGYLARLAASGVDGVWLPGVLYKLTPFPWDPSMSEHYEQRLVRLGELVARARRHRIGIYLYLNEPRSLPFPFFEAHPELKGVTGGDQATLCTSLPEVRDYLRNGVASVCRAVPDLAGIFTITASENLTNCWAHYGGEACPRCGPRGADEVIAEVNATIQEGIDLAGTATRLIAWDWGWRDPWARGVIERLPATATLMSVSEWSMQLMRGGVPSSVGEYSISAVGPGPRAREYWALARERGLRVMAKVQINNTWELSAVPYIPAVANIARHAANLREAGVDGLMLSWTLGGYPSPNMEVVAELGRSRDLTPEQAMARVAERRYGAAAVPAVVRAWQVASTGFSEFPYSGSLVYKAPLQTGPANLLWDSTTSYTASMVGFPYDDLDGWRDIYPVEIYIDQMRKVADGFTSATRELRRAGDGGGLSEAEAQALASDGDVAEACALHFASVANQAAFVQARRALAAADSVVEARPALEELEALLSDEIELARRLFSIQRRDSRIGFEATNQYLYVPLDLVEKVINGRDLLERWLPPERERWGLQQGIDGVPGSE